jgi:hypothetical protein
VKQPVERVEPPNTTPAPAVSLLPGRKLTEPDQSFIRDVAKCIRAGARPLTAAQWLGCSRKQWKRWRQRRGEPYDSLRTAVREALLHSEIKLQGEIARRGPGAAVKGLRRVRDDDGEEPSRGYQQHGAHALRRALPHLLQRVNDDAVPIDALTPVEQAARTLRQTMLADLGGAERVTAAKRVLVDNIIGSWIVAQSLDRFVFTLAETEGLASRKHRRAWPVIEQRMRVASVLTSQLQVLGLDRVSPPPISLDQYVAQRYGHGDVPGPRSEPDEAKPDA